jgi:hypothetical protein
MQRSGTYSKRASIVNKNNARSLVLSGLPTYLPTYPSFGRKAYSPVSNQIDKNRIIMNIEWNGRFGFKQVTTAQKDREKINFNDDLSALWTYSQPFQESSSNSQKAIIELPIFEQCCSSWTRRRSRTWHAAGDLQNDVCPFTVQPACHKANSSCI